ncbi:MAG: NAD(+) diphosphatase [Novosphingobium sp.]|nr:NAD(+) diphosphatase [Novosphingobium sp.]
MAAAARVPRRGARRFVRAGPRVSLPGIAFAGSRLDRADHLRVDEAALAKLADGEARLLRLDGIDPVIGGDGRLVWAALEDADRSAELVFLGLLDGRACFARTAQVGSTAPPDPQLWQLIATIPADDLATYGAARSLVDWHARHRFCARCGTVTHLAKGGWQRTCANPACRAEHFPRVDPVTIMLVEHDGNLLLGRQPRFPAKRYSALAGFVEPGESLEEAVAREVFEEAGVRVRDVSYVGSQPWPFPSSLMIGCHALADDPTITIDTTELDDARWFTRAEVADAVAASHSGDLGTAFGAPPPHAIAHHLLRAWLERG